jgi:hypothetical protein
MNMTISNAGGPSCVAVAGQIQEFIHELSAQLGKDAREIQRDARRAELLQGLEAAEHMREKAESVVTGAVIGGAITMASAVGQFDAAADFETSLSNVPHPDTSNGAVAELNGINNKAQANVNCFGSVASLGGSINQIFTAAGEREDASSQEAQVRSKAAETQASEADADLQAIQKIDDSAKDLLQEISRNQHAGMMAILSRQ